MASNTGSKSPGELEMTCSTSRRRGLLLQRLGEIVGALAQLGKQPRVLDRDDGLRGKTFDQLDLVRGERLHLLFVDADRPQQRAIPQHGYIDHAARAAVVGENHGILLAGKVGCFLADVLHVIDALCFYNAAERIIVGRPENRLPLSHLEKLERHVVQRHRPECALAFVEHHHAELGAANPSRPVQNGTEDQLELPGRIGDDLEDLRRRLLLLRWPRPARGEAARPDRPVDEAWRAGGMRAAAESAAV